LNIVPGRPVAEWVFSRAVYREQGKRTVQCYG
jgi:hypothetical protein